MSALLSVSDVHVSYGKVEAVRDRPLGEHRARMQTAQVFLRWIEA